MADVAAAQGSVAVLEVAPDSAMSFAAAAQVVLDYLVEHVPLGYWAITRVADGRQSYLRLGDNVYDLPQGGSHAWDDSYCRQMVDGAAPPIAPDAQAVPAYAAAGVNNVLQIGAYAGVPIHDSDGSLFGVICGLDPAKADGSLVDHQAVLSVLARMLEMVLAVDRARERAVLAAQQVAAEEVCDSLTGVLNRQGWEQLVQLEEEHLQVFGDPAAVLAVDVDGLSAINASHGHAAGDRVLATVAWCLEAACGPDAAVARVGGDEFKVLLRPCGSADAERVVGAISRELSAAGVAASLGWAPVTLGGGFAAAARRAEAALHDATSGRGR